MIFFVLFLLICGSPVHQSVLREKGENKVAAAFHSEAVPSIQQGAEQVLYKHCLGCSHSLAVSLNVYVNILSH